MRASPLFVLVLAVASPAVAEPLELGGFLGPRRFSPDVILGSDGQGQTSLSSSVVAGPRLAKPLLSWLVPELELALSPATTELYDVGVFWIEPRALVRFEFRPRGRVRPFLALGVGMATALSSKRKIYDTGVTVDGFGAMGIGWNPGRGVGVRLDFRAGMLPARSTANLPVTLEGELLLGVYFPIGRRVGAGAPRRTPELRPTPADRDGDGWADVVDQCPDQPEDHDGFEDKDGCPEIDNDVDYVLDISDKCPTVPETYNGFEDDDGCPDAVPAAIDAVIGTVEGLLYNPGEADVRAFANASLDKLAQTLTQHPTVRVVLVGHTDDQEALADAPPPDPADPDPAPPDGAALALELGRARAEAVKAALVARGIARGRITVDSAGATEPVSDNDTARSRMRNRRVDLRLIVPKRGT
ncbi:MAG: OmpA family protein [Kofleriaceae bacterium]